VDANVSLLMPFDLNMTEQRCVDRQWTRDDGVVINEVKAYTLNPKALRGSSYDRIRDDWGRLEEGEGDHAWGDVVLRAFEKEGRARSRDIHMKMKLDVESVDN
jgi:hypothetical protein